MILSIDWLQLYCRGILLENTNYRCKKMDYGTRQFKDVFIVSRNGRDICTVCANPHSSILHQLTLIIKFDNELLYSENCFSEIDNFLNSYNIKVLGLTRIDVACDFQGFCNKMTPSSLIDKFMRNKIRKIGQAKYKVIGEQKDCHSFDYLRFGSESSTISCYLYNKTKECNEVKMKRYITEKWESAGYDTKKDTWRLEFSIKSKQVQIVEKLTGDLQDIDYEYIKDECNVRKIFDCLQQTYFQFRTNSGKSNVTRERNLVLFKSYYTDIQRVIKVGEGDGTRSDKIFLRKMENLSRELRESKREEVQVIENVMFELLTKKGLENYYKSRISGSLVDRIESYLDDNKMRVQESLMSEKLPLVQYDLFDNYKDFN